jgi:hypothetical protein
MFILYLLLFCDNNTTAPEKRDNIVGSWKLISEIKSICRADTLIISEVYYPDSTEIHYKLITADSLFTYDYYSEGNGFRLRNGSSFLREYDDTVQTYKITNFNFLEFEFSEADWQIASASADMDTLFMDHYSTFEPYSVERDSANNFIIIDSVWKRSVYISNLSVGLPKISGNVCHDSCYSGILIDLDSFIDSVTIETLNVEIYDTIKTIGVSEKINHWQILNIFNPVCPPDYEVLEVRDTIGDSIHYFFNFIPMTKTDEDILFFKNEDQNIVNSDSNSLEAEVIIIVRLNVD